MSILFDCIIMPPYHNGTSEYQISTFDAFCRLFGDKYDLYMYTSREADGYFGISERYSNVLYPDTIGERVFHLGFVPNQLYIPENQSAINRRCLKVISTIYDIICMRCHEHQIGNMHYNNYVRMGFNLCDGIITISDYTMRDLQAFFPDDARLGSIPKRVILITTESSRSEKDKGEVAKLPFEEFFLVVGNAFLHKALREIVQVIEKTEYNYIVIGLGDVGFYRKNIYGFEGGTLSEGLMDLLYERCRAVVFPSLYEGFGLPTVKGLCCGKRVILFDNALGRELLCRYADFSDYFLFFKTFEQIADILRDTDFTTPLTRVVFEDSWDTVAVEIEAFFAEILGGDVCVEKLVERWWFYRHLDALMRRCESVSEELSDVYGSFSWRVGHLLMRLCRVFVPRRKG